MTLTSNPVSNYYEMCFGIFVDQNSILFIIYHPIGTYYNKIAF